MSGALGGPAWRDSLENCAMLAQLRGDPMLGTAFPASRILLIEQPGPWGRGGLRESQFDPRIAARLERDLGAANVRVVAIRRPGRRPSAQPRRWGFADCRPGRESLVWGEFVADGELLELDPSADVIATSAAAAIPDRAPTYLVCAHSRHDPCCALRGRPVAAALAAARPGRVWECSHIGGERFAANVLVLPVGLVYGRILSFSAAEFADVADRGEVVPALLRGRVGLPPAAQAAAAFGYALEEAPKASDVQVLSVDSTDPAHVLVRVATPQGAMEISVLVERSSPAKLTCQATGPATAWVYRPVEIRPAA
ncbi:MAG: sucrase ferredoxin [bacterium]